MLAHLRANLWLLILTVAICCGIYPAALWVVGKVAFPSQAEGSLIREDGKIVGSRLVAQEFKGDEWFQSRPSAAGYNAAASGASNWGANNYALRDRIARTLGPIVKYKSGPNKGKLAADDIVAWFRADKHAADQPGIVADWAKSHSGLAQAWVKADDVAKEFVKAWFEKHAAELDAWKKENVDKSDPSPEDLAVPFFESFSKELPGTWLAVNEKKDDKNETVKNEKGEAVKVVDLVKPDDKDSGDIASVFFDAWRQVHADVALEDVPADLVMASSSGLDPHITLQNAKYQLDRVASAWAAKSKTNESEVRRDIEAILTSQARAPLGGLVGVPLINVLVVNRELKTKFGG